MKIKRAILLIFLLSLFGASIARAEGQPKIVVDIPATYELVKNLVGDGADIEILYAQGQSDHQFSLKPSQAEAIANADYIFGIGSVYAPNLVKAAHARAKSGAGIAFYDDDYLQKGRGEFGIVNQDPHLWLSPEHLAQMDEFYREILASSVAPLVLDVPKGEAKVAPIITSHEAFDYFENYSGLHSQGALHDLQDQPLPPRAFAELNQKIAAGDVQCLLMETGDYSQDAADFAKENQLSVINFDVLGWEYLDQTDFFATYFAALTKAYQDCH